MFSSFAACCFASLTSRNLPWRKSAISRALRSSPSTMTSSPASGTSDRPWISTGMAGPALDTALPFSSVIARTRPNTAPGEHDVAALQRARMHEHRRDRALALVEPRLDDDAARRRVLRRLQLEHFGLQQDRVEELVDARAGLGRHRNELRLAAVLLGNHALGDELLLDALEIRLRLVDLVDRDDDRHVAGLRVRDRFLRLRHHAVVGRDDQNRRCR